MTLVEGLHSCKIRLSIYYVRAIDFGGHFDSHWLNTGDGVEFGHNSMPNLVHPQGASFEYRSPLWSIIFLDLTWDGPITHHQLVAGKTWFLFGVVSILKYQSGWGRVAYQRRSIQYDSGKVRLWISSNLFDSWTSKLSQSMRPINQISSFGPQRRWPSRNKHRPWSWILSACNNHNNGHLNWIEDFHWVAVY